MPDKQQKLLRGPALVTGVHSSGNFIIGSSGKNIYIEQTITDEEVTYRLERNKKGYRLGRLENIVTPSVHRIKPVCSHFGECGGCNWQHINYHHQLRLKHHILTEALNKYSVAVPPLPPVIASPSLYYYRHRIEYAITPDGRPGFHRQGNSGKIADIRECYLQQQPSRDICDFVSDFIKEIQNQNLNDQPPAELLTSLSIRVNRKGECMVETGLTSNESKITGILIDKLIKQFPGIISVVQSIKQPDGTNKFNGDKSGCISGTPYIHERLNQRNFRISAPSFFQPNVEQAEQIINTLMLWAEFAGNETVYDLYTGVGSIALSVAPYVKGVTGIEGNTYAIEDARENAIFNKIYNVQFITGDILQTFNSGFIRENGKPSVIILDPPRSGTLIEIKKTINASGAAKVIYLSCNPVSLAFDLKQLSEVYTVEKIMAFDMFPHTHHLETLVLLSHK